MLRAFILLLSRMRTLFSVTITGLQLARGPTAGSDLLLLCRGMLCPAPRGVLGQGLLLLVREHSQYGAVRLVPAEHGDISRTEQPCRCFTRTVRATGPPLLPSSEPEEWVMKQAA